jgi:hypothetical protein
VPAAEPAVLAWDTDATSDDRHTYSVQISTDNGTTANGSGRSHYSKTQIPIDYKQFGDAKQVLIRVIATDGFQRSETTTSLSAVESGSR